MGNQGGFRRSCRLTSIDGGLVGLWGALDRDSCLLRNYIFRYVILVNTSVCIFGSLQVNLQFATATSSGDTCFAFCNVSSFGTGVLHLRLRASCVRFQGFGLLLSVHGCGEGTAHIMWQTVLCTRIRQCVMSIFAL